MATALVPPQDYVGLPANETPPETTDIDLTIFTGQAGGKTNGDR